MHGRSRSAGEAHAENHVRPRSSAARGNSAQHGPRGRTLLSQCSGMRSSRRRERVWPARKVTQSQTSHEAAEPLGRPSCLAWTQAEGRSAENSYRGFGSTVAVSQLR